MEGKFHVDFHCLCNVVSKGEIWLEEWEYMVGFKSMRLHWKYEKCRPCRPGNKQKVLEILKEKVVKFRAAVIKAKEKYTIY